MSELTVFNEGESQSHQIRTRDFDAIRRELDSVGIRFERWEARQPLKPGASQAEILEAYRDSVERLKQERGFKTADVLSMVPDHPDKAALRNKFLNEHTHTEDEVRFFVEGQGLFSIHKGGRVFNVLCEKGDLIGVPDGTPHWFDMGPQPRFTAIRLFTNTEGWVAHHTGSDIASRFPRFE
ncbi:acireductone dioxygenase [Vitiosangium sp. GDMCC 1.1324]|uniref:1,2-dihydroxy-3-keto-5-methylthiopentene dioxygenase n=1 Tax=Vitiosangium sp. (strain GDMCC 1.1324) TaxID=2138576 RepID=UPI000D39661A|nr:cupin [Vitiosangium sp. GDMCC 1.1324]PTL84644.1 cupin [Vitiosangium sp. GDMCC 1.1324]